MDTPQDTNLERVERSFRNSMGCFLRLLCVFLITLAGLIAVRISSGSPESSSEITESSSEPPKAGSGQTISLLMGCDTNMVMLSPEAQCERVNERQSTTGGPLCLVICTPTQGLNGLERQNN